jgi:hypothetical protein
MNEERSSPRRPQEELDETTCWELLTRTSVGRLAVDIAGQPDIFPINYIVDGATIVFRSGAGTKLAGAVLNHHVAFEIDGYTPDRRTAWSVVVKGRARQIDSMLDVYRASSLARHSTALQLPMMKAASRGCSLALIGTAHKPACHSPNSTSTYCGQLPMYSTTRLPGATPWRLSSPPARRATRACSSP